MELKCDQIDRRIIELLQQNAKLSMKEISSEIGLTITPTHERIRRLERSGIIKGYSARIDKTKLGIRLRVFCHVSLREHNFDLLQQFESEVVGFSEVLACYHTAGDYDYTLLVEVADMEAYELFLRSKMTGIPSISNVQSVFIMRALKE